MNVRLQAFKIFVITITYASLATFVNKSVGEPKTTRRKAQRNPFLGSFVIFIVPFVVRSAYVGQSRANHTVLESLCRMSNNALAEFPR